MKRAVIKVLQGMGWELHRFNARSSQWARIQRLLSTSKISAVLDVGANNGQYARKLRDTGFKGRIISFEPLSSVHPVLCNSAKSDPLWVIAPPMAIGSNDGLIDINISRNSQSSSVLEILSTHTNAAPESNYIASETVRLTRLDSIASGFLQSQDIIFLKVDVQGFESQVIGGAKDLMPRVKGVQLELSFVPLYEGQVLAYSMISYMRDLGFNLWSLIPSFLDNQTGQFLQADGIFIRE